MSGGQTGWEARPVLVQRRLRRKSRGTFTGCRIVSVHKLLHTMVCQSKISSALAAEFAEALARAKRAQDYTEVELISGKLGRAGKP